ncbi:MAG: GreA/GreB family elongation factor [Xanthobacteraceae bacterium]
MNTTLAQFGHQVTIRRGDGRQQTLRIVGEDEADPSQGLVSHAAPIARAVMGPYGWRDRRDRRPRGDHYKNKLGPVDSTARSSESQISAIANGH